MADSLKALKLLQKIPKGNVSTYGSLAKACGTSPRAVGQILRKNTEPQKYPCYKIISSSGKIHGYAGCLSGKNIQKKILLLKKDGIKIKNGKIDLKKYNYCF
jgi:O-6-methylguanine DNA methyltransferase